MTETLAGRPLVGFDLETTGTDPFEARIVTASLCAAHVPDRTWLADPGIEIPDGAAAVHGITTEHAQQHGRPADQVVDEIATALRDLWASGHIVVIYNASYDLRVVHSELQRHGLPMLQLGTVLDPLVLWRKAEKYRKGKKTLSEAVTRFGVTLTNAHESAADATAAVQVTEQLATLVPWPSWTHVQAMSLQEEWSREWAGGFASWLRDKGGDWRAVDGSWPLGGSRG